MIPRRKPLRRYKPLARSRKPIRRDARTEEEKRKDREWRAAVLERDGLKCILCCKGLATIWPLDAHHIHGKATKALRWDVSNGVALCRAHHDWVHAHPKEGKELLQ